MSMLVRMCRCICMCMCICTCVCTCICMCICMCMCICTCVCVCVYVCVCVCVYVILCICMCIRPYVYNMSICLYIYIYIYIYTCTDIDMCLNFWCLRISCKLWKALSTTGDTTVYDALIGCCFSFWQRISGRAKAFCVGYLSSIVAMLVAGTFWNPVQTDVGCWFKPLCGHWYMNPVGIPHCTCAHMTIQESAW